MKATKVIEQLSFDYPSASKLLKDNFFLDGLQEEIDFFKDNSPKNVGYAIFSINESGNIVFDGVQSEPGEDVSLSICLNDELEDGHTTGDLLEELKKMEEDRALVGDDGTIEKKKLQEKINSLITQLQEIGKIVEKMKVTPTKPLVEQAQSIINYDISRKKQQLLDKLLKNK